MEGIDWSLRLRPLTNRRRCANPVTRSKSSPTAAMAPPSRPLRGGRVNKSRARGGGVQVSRQCGPCRGHCYRAPPPATALPAAPVDHSGRLSSEMWLKIFSYLTLPQRVRVRAVCRRWYCLGDLSLRSLRFVNLARYFVSGLSSYGLAHRRQLTDKLFRQLLSRLPNLKRLHLGAAAGALSRIGILSIGKLCPSLVDLDISYMRMSYRSLENLCRNCPKLQRVRLPRFCFKEQCLDVLLKYLGELRSLKLESVFVTGACFNHLPCSLRSLSLHGCSRISAANLQLIGSRCPSLTQLSLSHSNVDSTALRHIAQGCRCLEVLDVRSCAAVRLEDAAEWLPELRRLSAGLCRQFDSVAAQSLVTHCRRLEKLYLTGNCSQHGVPGAALQLLARLPRLRHLDLSGQSNVTSDVLDALGYSCSLQTLVMRRCHTPHSDVYETALVNMVSRCATLSSLDVSDIDCITDQTYALLVASVSKQRHLVLTAENTPLASALVRPAAHVTRVPPVSGHGQTAGRRRGSVAWRPGRLLDSEDESDDDTVPVPWQGASDSDTDQEEQEEAPEFELMQPHRLVNVFADWLWINNALWGV